MTGLNVASRDVMKTAQIIDCVHPSTLNAALQEVKPEASVLIVATLTEFIISNGFSGTLLSTIDPILASFVTQICGYCAFRPTLQVSSTMVYFLFVLCNFNRRFAIISRQASFNFDLDFTET